LSAGTYLVVGHITLDVAGSGYRLGGTATYAALTASRLGLAVRVLTSSGQPGLAAFSELGVPAEVHALPAADTTVFHNSYVSSGRRQRLLSVASRLCPRDLPHGWLGTDVVHLGPLAQEVDEGFLLLTPAGSTLGVTPQGWLRSWDANGAVSPCRWEPDPELLARVSAIVLSVEDVGGDLSLIDYYARYCPITVITEGYRGCTLRLSGESVSLATRPAMEVDPTGAGDVFAAAFLIHLQETGDPLAAAKFANIAGSFSVEGVGAGAIASRATVEGWLAANPGFPWFSVR